MKKLILFFATITLYLAFPNELKSGDCGASCSYTPFDFGYECREVLYLFNGQFYWVNMCVSDTILTPFNKVGNCIIQIK